MLNKGYMVMDSIHGGIKLDKHETAVMDHRLFQRLRSVAQNDVLDRVFPGATHTRFIHSIGAMHMASKMFNSVVNKAKTDLSGFTYQSEEAIQYLKGCLRLAVLLHDCGHGAFSHQLETAPEIQKLLYLPNHFEKMWDGVNWSKFYDEEPEHIEHEHYSIRVAYEILTDVSIGRKGYHRQDVLGIMETTLEDPSAKFINATKMAWPYIVCNDKEMPSNGRKAAQMMMRFLSKILSNEIDSDKCDYMLRDSIHSSVSYGQYNLDTLIENIGCAYIKESDWLGMVLVNKGLSAFEDFIYSRFQLYTQIYNHKASIMYDLILHKAIGEVLKCDDIYAEVESMMTTIKEFEYLTDDYFWEKFRSHMREHPDSYCAKIVRREKLKFIGRVENLQHFSLERKRKDFAKDLNCDVEEVLYFKSRAKFSKISHDFDDIRVVYKEPITGKYELRSIAECSRFFDKFEDLSIANFYRKQKGS